MILDVGGRRHKVLESNFSVFPNTRLGKLARARNEEEILGLCDGYREDDGVGVPEYFFDRNWTRYTFFINSDVTTIFGKMSDIVTCNLVNLLFPKFQFQLHSRYLSYWGATSKY